MSTETKEQSLVTIDGQTLNLSEMGERLKSMTKGGLLTTEYMKFEAGEVTRVIFVETTEINSRKNDGSKETAVKLVDEDGTLRINADKALVSTLMKLSKLTPVEISCTGEKISPKGSYKTFDVHALN